MTNNIDTSALVTSLYQNKNKLDDKATDAQYVGGLHFGGIGIPNKLLFNVFQSDSQKQDLEAPGMYQSAMDKLIATLNEALNIAAKPYNN